MLHGADAATDNRVGGDDGGEYYLQTQMDVLKQGVALFVDKYKANQA